MKVSGTLKIEDREGVRLANRSVDQHRECGCNGSYAMFVELCSNALTATIWIPEGNYHEETLKAFAVACRNLFGVHGYAVSFQSGQLPEETSDQPQIVMQ